MPTEFICIKRQFAYEDNITKALSLADTVLHSKTRSFCPGAPLFLSTPFAAGRVRLLTYSQDVCLHEGLLVLRLPAFRPVQSRLLITQRFYGQQHPLSNCFIITRPCVEKRYWGLQVLTAKLFHVYISKLMSMEMDFLRRSAKYPRLEKNINNVIKEKINIKNLVLDYIRLNWYDYVHWMNEEWVPLKNLEWYPSGRRWKGRPRNSWIQEVTIGMKEAN